MAKTDNGHFYTDDLKNKQTNNKAATQAATTGIEILGDMLQAIVEIPIQVWSGIAEIACACASS